MLKLANRLLWRGSALFIVITGIWLTIGPRQPASEIEYPGFDSCTLPCWAGITPAETYTEDIPALMSTHLPGMQLELRQVIQQISFTAANADRVITGIAFDVRGQIEGLRFSPGLPLWQLIDLLGMPACVRSEQGQTHEVVTVSWEIETHSIGATLLLPTVYDWRLSALTDVVSVFTSPACTAAVDRPWQGFAAVWRYRSS